MPIYRRRRAACAFASIATLLGSCVSAPPEAAGYEQTREADKYETAIAVFKDAGASGSFFGTCYGFAVFPTIAEGAFGLGGAHGKGRVYVQGDYVGDVTMSQLSLGFQVGVQAYREVIFLQDERAFREFTSGDFEFGAETGLVFVTTGASASAGSYGATAAVGHRDDPITAGGYRKGMAVFAATKGGGMVKLSVAGQQFSYRPREIARP